ncbi:3-oxoacyl-ACP synthase III family protein [Micromonospora sp. DT228]|uniref:3-oxoacyl-ACP synthase III family protein n=1 Tax=Micromonospora sp. DT228 TaxID=3393443 RepID=UPI003CF0D9C1
MSSLRNGTGILGTGSYLPRKELTNEEIAERFDVTEEWILRKTRIRSRRYASPSEAVSDLAVKAGRQALRAAGITADQIDYLIVTTGTGDHPFPPTSCLVQAMLGAERAACFDVNIGCSGFVYGVALARGMSTFKPDGYSLVISADLYSRFVDPDDLGVVVLLADGAGAAVLGPVPDSTGILDVELRGRGDRSELLKIEAGGSRRPASLSTLAEGGHYLRMMGREVTSFVMETVPGSVSVLLDRAGVDPSDVDHFVPHQANGVILERLADLLELKKAQIHRTIERYGNMGSASLAVTLDEANRAGHLHDGDLVMLSGFGGGMALGNCLLRWVA